MKEDLEARERGSGPAGVKRAREEKSEMAQEIRKLAEEGRKRRAARATMMAENTKSATSPTSSNPTLEETTEQHASTSREPEEDAVERLERRIREAEQAKAKRRAEKKARKSGVFALSDPLIPEFPGSDGGIEKADEPAGTPINRPDIGPLSAGKRPRASASPKFSFSPNTPNKKDFSATMARLKAAEKQRLEQEIRKQDSEVV